MIGGFSFSDVRDAGVAFSLVTTGNENTARAALDSLDAIAWRLRDAGQPAGWDLDAVLADVKTKDGGPWLLMEPADNVGGGAPGDCTSILRGLLRHRIGNACVMIAVPQAVAALVGAAPGDTRALSIGGKRSEFDPGPVDLTVTLIRISDGEFDLEDRNSHMVASQGRNFSMGPSAVVEAQGITILLNRRKIPPFDLAQLRSQGIELTTLSVIGIKAAVAHRRAYDPVAAGTYVVTTPTPCSSDLTMLPHSRLRRPIHPLDKVDTPRPEISKTNQGDAI